MTACRLSEGSTKASWVPASGNRLPLRHVLAGVPVPVVPAAVAAVLVAAVAEVADVAR